MNKSCIVRIRTNRRLPPSAPLRRSLVVRNVAVSGNRLGDRARSGAYYSVAGDRIHGSHGTGVRCAFHLCLLVPLARGEPPGSVNSGELSGTRRAPSRAY